ncbi:MAG: hypothetical protein LBI13_02065 [Streptococcaceae bacterium]|jgi:hypothetical protein|nr:hypothetical protein [Streptococcaceae bacterium]
MNEKQFEEIIKAIKSISEVRPFDIAMFILTFIAIIIAIGIALWSKHNTDKYRQQDFNELDRRRKEDVAIEVEKYDKEKYLSIFREQRKQRNQHYSVIVTMRIQLDMNKKLLENLIRSPYFQKDSQGELNDVHTNFEMLNQIHLEGIYQGIDGVSQELISGIVGIKNAGHFYNKKIERFNSYYFSLDSIILFAQPNSPISEMNQRKNINRTIVTLAQLVLTSTIELHDMCQEYMAANDIFLERFENDKFSNLNSSEMKAEINEMWNFKIDDEAIRERALKNQDNKVL